MATVCGRSCAAARLASDDSRGDQVRDAERFWQHAPNRGEGERFLDLRLLCTDIGHPECSVPGANRLKVVPTNHRESFLPVVETAAQCGLHGIEIGFFPGDRDDGSVDCLVDRVDIDDIEAADRGPVDQDCGEPGQVPRTPHHRGDPLRRIVPVDFGQCGEDTFDVPARRPTRDPPFTTPFFWPPAIPSPIHSRWRPFASRAAITAAWATWTASFPRDKSRSERTAITSL